MDFLTAFLPFGILIITFVKVCPQIRAFICKLTQSRCANIGLGDSTSVSVRDTVSTKAARCDDASSCHIPKYPLTSLCNKKLQNPPEYVSSSVDVVQLGTIHN